MTLQRILLLSSVLALSVAGRPAMASDSVQVTANNYVRAETDFQMQGYVEKFDCFGKFVHSRKPYDVNNQVTVRANRDTLYSFGVFDLRSPVTVTLPDTGGRYQSLMIISQDHSISSLYGPTEKTLTEANVGSRYVFLGIRTFADPNDEQDMKEAYQAQDTIHVTQADIGEYQVPNWKKEEVEQMRNTIYVVASTVSDSSKMFGIKEDLDPVYWMLGAAFGWGGLPAKDASYMNGLPEMNDGSTPHTLTVKAVPVDAFWSVTLYDDQGWMPVNEHNAYSYNNVTAEKGQDGSVTIHFGGDSGQPNFLPIVPGWNYLVRLYRPRQEILDGSWVFPPAKPVD
jgi:hypothetical protein